MRHLRLGRGALIAFVSLCALAPGLARAAVPTVAVSPTSGSPGRGLTVTGSNWTSGDSIFIQIGSSTFDTDVVCVLTASSEGTIAGTKPNGNCQIPNVPAGSRSLVAIDQQNEAMTATGANFTVVPGLVLTPSNAAAGSPASPGTTISAQGHGFTGSSAVSAFKFDAAALATSPTSIGTDGSGNFTGPVTFTVPSTTAGTHTVSATDGSAKTGSATLTIFTPKISVSPASAAPGHGLTVSGSGFPAGDTVFVQIGSSTFDTDVVCALTASPDGTIAGTKTNGNCQVPSVPDGSRSLVAIDQQNQGVQATGTAFPVVPGLTLTPSGASVGTPASPGATVTMQGGGFTASSTVSGFKFDAAALSTFPTSIGTDGSGNFTGPVTFTVPSTTAGTHTVSATDGSAKKGTGTLKIYTPKISVSPASAAPGHGLTVSGSGFPAGDTVFVQIGSGTFDTDVVCALTASPDGTIAGTKTNGNCQVPNVPAGSRSLVAIDQQNQGVLAIGTPFNLVPGLTLTPSGASAGTPASPGATVTIQGGGFTGLATVSSFKFDAAALSTSPTSISTDGNGTFTGPVTFTVPNTTAGTHTVSASDGSKTGSGKLTIYTPKISVSPASASPGRGLTVSGSGFPAGDTVFVQIGSSTFDTDVVCALTASPDGTIAGTKTNGNCQLPNLPAGSRSLVAIDQQNQGVLAIGTPYTVVPGLTLTPSGASAGSPASPGATVTIQGGGFTGLSTVSGFKFNAAALTTSPTSISTDGNGTFTGPVTFIVPNTTAGTHAVFATDGSAKTGSGTLTIFLPKISVSPTSGAPGQGLTVSGSGFPAGDTVFVQIGSTTFDSDVVCVLTAAQDGAIAGNKSNGNCQLPTVSVGLQPLVAIDQQNQGVIATGTKFNVT